MILLTALSEGYSSTFWVDFSVGRQALAIVNMNGIKEMICPKIGLLLKHEGISLQFHPNI